jgi:hypothetical protein
MKVRDETVKTPGEPARLGAETSHTSALPPRLRGRVPFA